MRDDSYQPIEQNLSDRLQQQTAVAQLGRKALIEKDIYVLMDEAATLICKILGIEYGRVLEVCPKNQNLILRAGVCSNGRSLNKFAVSAQTGPYAAHTLRLHEPALLAEHGIASGITITIGPQDAPYGVIGAHTSENRIFSKNDIDFLQAIAQILAGAIRRKRTEETLHKREQQYQSILTKLPEAILIFDDTGRCLSLFGDETLMGVSSRPLIGETVDRILPPPLAHKARETMAHTLETDTDQHLEYSLDIQGEFQWFFVTLVKFTWENEPCILWTARKGTEKRAELVLAGENRVLEMVAADASLTDILDELNKSVEASFPNMLCAILLLDPDDRRLRHASAPTLPKGYVEAIEGVTMGPDAGSWGVAGYLGKQIVTADIATDPLWDSYRDIALAHGLQACWATPIHSSTHTLLGIFSIYYREVRSPKSQDFEFMRRLAHLARIAIERRQSEEALQAEEKRYRLLYDNSPSLFFTLDDRGYIRSVNLFGAQQLGYQVEELLGKPFTELHGGGEIADFEHQFADCLGNPKTIKRQELCLIRGDGSLLWIRSVARTIANSHGIFHLLLVCEDITEDRALSQKLSYQASHDPLTSLINRREFEQRLTRVLRTAHEDKTEHVLCYIDLDQFKIINDTSGHVAGDELLRQIGGLLREQVRKRDTLARLGGDEFGVLLEHCAIDQAERVAENIRKTIEEFRFQWEDRTFRIGASIGLVAINEFSRDIIWVLNAADSACYTAKNGGRNRIHVYRDGDLETVKHQWLYRIDQAFEEDRFLLVSQPLMPLDGHQSQRIYHELLIRMRDTEGNILLPGAFLPAAERHHLSVKLDRWVISKAFEWLNQHPDLLEKTYLWAINLSSLSLNDEEFLQFVIDEFSRTHMAPGKICFEIAEIAATTNLTNATRFIRLLKERGCYFALDDFGSSLSSFVYLRNLPVDFLKIDGFFVKDILDDPIDWAMVKSINEIGRVMGKQMIAKFVENGAILAKLREIGVNYAQGYGIGYPQPIQDMITT